METTDINTHTRRRTGIAVMLSLIMPGIGHVYCGRLVRGIILAFLTSAIIPVIMASLAMTPSTTRNAAFILSNILLIAIGLIAVIDSALLARRTRRDYQLKEYNRWYIYLLLVLMATGGTSGYALHIRDKYLEAFVVPAVSMYPTIIPGDRILVKKQPYLYDNPHHGDLVVFTDPDNPRQNFIKRIVALPGDTVAIKDGQLIINGRPLPRKELPPWTLATIETRFDGEIIQGDLFEETLDDRTYTIILADHKNANRDDFGPITVPKHHCFVLGDNRNLSRDSRAFGPVPLAALKGRVHFLYFPARDFSRFGHLE